MPVRESKRASISCAVLATQRAGYCRTDLLSFPFVFMNIPGSFVHFCDAVVRVAPEPSCEQLADRLTSSFVFINIPGSFVYFCDAVVTAVREPPLQATWRMAEETENRGNKAKEYLKTKNLTF